MKIRMLAEAEGEVEAARRYLNKQSLGLGARLLNELADSLAAVSANPLAFPKLETLPDDQPYRRALLATLRYAIVYEVLATEIVVVAVVHTSREPNYWLGRLK